MAKEKSIHGVLSKLLRLAQVFGFFPLQNLNSDNVDNLKYNPISLRMIYSILAMLGSFFMLAMQVRKIYRTELTLHQSERFMWYSYGVIANVALIVTAKKWKRFIKIWCTAEKSMNLYYGWTKGLHKRVNFVATGLFILAAIEYLSYYINKFDVAYRSKSDIYEAITYLLGDLIYRHIFDFVPFNIPTAIILQIINIQITFAWNFVDIFIIAISICLTFRMKQITERVEKTSYLKSSDQKTWKHLRQDYCRLHHLCKFINSQLWYLILLSLTSNLYYLLVQFFNTLQDRPIFSEKAYFNFSFTLLIFRIVSFCLFSGMVYEESRKPLRFLVYISSDVYNPEIQVFIEQISTSEVAISGYNLFYIRPDLILKIAGALVTYELVLLEGMKSKNTKWD